MSKELEALNDLREIKGWNDKEFNQRLDIIEKSLKALEIIKKFICLGEVIEDDLFPYVLELKEQYVSNSSSNVLSKEEYDLLKEILE